METLHILNPYKNENQRRERGERRKAMETSYELRGLLLNFFVANVVNAERQWRQSNCPGNR